MREILITKTNEVPVIAVVCNGNPTEFIVCNEQSEVFTGSIYKGIVKKWRPDLDAYFVDIGHHKDAFLSKRDTLLDRLTIGDPVLVQVVKASERFKGPKVTMHIKLSGQRIVYMPFSGYTAASKQLSRADRETWLRVAETMLKDREGLILRTAVKEATREELASELAKLRDLSASLKALSLTKQAPACLYGGANCLERALDNVLSADVKAVVTDCDQLLTVVKKKLEQRSWLFSQLDVVKEKRPLFRTYGIAKDWERAQKRVVWLQSGAYLLIDETESVTIIDVNTGRSHRNWSKQKNAVMINREAAKEAARQLRLRNIGGMIVIDFLRMDSEQERRNIASELTDALKSDQRTTTLFGFTAMGLFELTRKKVGSSLKESLAIGSSKRNARSCK